MIEASLETDIRMVPRTSMTVDCTKTSQNHGIQVQSYHSMMPREQISSIIYSRQN